MIVRRKHAWGARLPRAVSDRYEVIRPLAAGGMADVYLARPRATTRGARRGLVVVKVPRESTLAHATLEARAAREAAACRRVRHAGVVRLVEVVTDATGSPAAIVLEHAEGETLRERLRRGPLDDKELRSLAEQTAQALAAVHRVGVVHRDVKPENLLLAPRGRVKLLDLGLSAVRDARRITATGELLGSPAYCAPEQLLSIDRAADPRVDLYSLGVVLFEAASGRLPWDGDARPWRGLAPPRLADVAPATPLDVARLTDRLLSPLPSQRPRSAVSVVRALAAGRRATGPGGLRSRARSLAVERDDRAAGALADALDAALDGRGSVVLAGSGQRVRATIDGFVDRVRRGGAARVLAERCAARRPRAGTRDEPKRVRPVRAVLVDAARPLAVVARLRRQASPRPTVLLVRGVEHASRASLSSLAAAIDSVAAMRLVLAIPCADTLPPSMLAWATRLPHVRHVAEEGPVR